MMNSMFISHGCFLLSCPKFTQWIVIRYALCQYIETVSTPGTQLSKNNFQLPHFRLHLFVLLCIIQTTFIIEYTWNWASWRKQQKKIFNTHPLTRYVCSNIKRTERIPCSTNQLKQIYFSFSSTFSWEGDYMHLIKSEMNNCVMIPHFWLTPNFQESNKNGVYIPVVVE